MESVKTKKATKMVAYKQLQNVLQVLSGGLFADAECKICKYK